MTRDLALLLSLIVIAACWLMLHFVLLRRALGARSLPQRLRWLAWLPPATPVIGWLAGARVLSVIWAGIALVYVWLRSLA